MWVMIVWVLVGEHNGIQVTEFKEEHRCEVAAAWVNEIPKGIFTTKYTPRAKCFER
jgi:hypothetical protein